MVDVISSSSENPIVLTIGNIPSQSHTLILIWLFSLLKQDEAKKETPPIIAHFHQRYSLNNKWSNRSNGNFAGLPGGHSNNKGSTSHFSNKNLFDNQGKHNVQGNQGSLKSPQHHWHPNHGNNQRRIVCQLCDKVGHNAKVCCSHPQTQFSPQVNYMASELVRGHNTWIFLL